MGNPVEARSSALGTARLHHVPSIALPEGSACILSRELSAVPEIGEAGPTPTPRDKYKKGRKISDSMLPRRNESYRSSARTTRQVWREKRINNRGRHSSSMVIFRRDKIQQAHNSTGSWLAEKLGKSPFHANVLAAIAKPSFCNCQYMMLTFGWAMTNFAPPIPEQASLAGRRGRFESKSNVTITYILHHYETISFIPASCASATIHFEIQSSRRHV
ncbi:hypothetical protein THAOC_05574 [Thalassiosira oceanica]|uniref:Uncharacterized protein n=1 Tax=Thalassiosira oceanica TaxID=159749 RepID=K0T6Z5_THAOC|nr:hypothetical protein THAOC_05574 [Thalassiosira oceanica]|eukprot:EJK72854.1 hypothetical protein THAOC_05574 [Thalassiosira oceanica]